MDIGPLSGVPGWLGRIAAVGAIGLIVIWALVHSGAINPSFDWSGPGLLDLTP